MQDADDAPRNSSSRRSAAAFASGARTAAKARSSPGFAHHLERCAVCGLVYERNPGDTWAFTIIGDRLPIAAIIVLIYFGVGALASAARRGASILALGGLLVWTAPNRWGAGIALHYLSRVFWPDPADPVPATCSRRPRSTKITKRQIR